MKVVSDSTALIALARIGQLNILEKMVESLIIPSAVYDDVVIKGAGKPGAIELKEAKWIEKKDVSNKGLVRRLNAVLGHGESETVALAKEIKADLIILDDDKARKVARSEGLKVSGLLALLIQAKEAGIIKRIKPLIERLKENEFFLTEELCQDILKKVGE